ncbi:cytosine permease [Acetobacteraceae bacterium KSS8]|uniref:Cytosine permease n=1 Tax=Endosaccharibacter trunci TaxID=2812733 RepID=A0ABT1W6Z2_9PROT|nr:cytosine permease [Acetobacteraceae bacterium KSS8]
MTATTVLPAPPLVRPHPTIERAGIEPVAPDARTVRWQDLFSIIINFQINPGQILVAGMAVAAGLSFWQAVVAQVSGTMVAFLAYVTMATVGVDHGIPGQTATRMAFGLRGAKLLPSTLRTIASVYWFGFQTVAGSLAIVAVLDRWTGTPHGLLGISLCFGAVQAVVAAIGYNSLKLLSRVALPVKLLILAWMGYTLLAQPDPGFRPGAVWRFQQHHAGWVLFAAWFNTALATWLTMITDAADFCRYSRSRRDMWIGTLLAVLVGILLVSLVGAYAAAATSGRSDNAFEVVAHITGGHLALTLILLMVVLDNWTINVLNLYTGGLSLLNVLERLGRFRATLIVSVVGIALSAFPSLVHGYSGWIGTMGMFFAPLSGVLLADYLFVRRGTVDVPGLFERSGPYWYRAGFNPVAIVWTILGFVASATVIPAWLPVSVGALVLSGAGYLVSMRMLPPPQGAAAG